MQTLALSTLSADAYAREVLPLTAALWARTRSLEEYVADYRSLASSAFGQRRLRSVALEVDGRVVASCKRFLRTLRCEDRRYSAIGIGSVFTPADLRRRGYATAMLGALLDAERAAGTDLAFLFSDIAPAFYASLGFIALPSRQMTIRSDALPRERLPLVALDPFDPGALRRTFEAHEAQRPYALTRSPLDWEFQKLYAAVRANAGQPLALGLKRGRRLAAYVYGRRVPKADAFVVDEFAFGNADDAGAIAPLLRAAAGDLRKIQGWLPPAIARTALGRAAVRKRTDGITMVIPLSRACRASWSRTVDSVLHAEGDPIWSTDHI
jgi:predicted N-acetyltransferase YhbS